MEEKKKQCKTSCWRQGEIIFEKLNFKTSGGGDTFGKVMAGMPKRENGVLAEGEVTGHLHEVKGVKGEEYELYDIEGGDSDRGRTVHPEGQYQMRLTLPAGQMLLHVNEGGKVKIEHPEHKTVVLGQGDYVVRQQREYDEERSRLVRD